MAYSKQAFIKEFTNFVSMEIENKIGLRIRELRKERNISQQELSYQSDTDRTYLTQVENGKRNISIKNLFRITNALKISIKEFFNHETFENY